jgi:hypothetical protein
MPLGKSPSQRAVMNIGKLKKAVRVVGSVAAATDVWQRGSQARAAMRREILSKPASSRSDEELLLLEEILIRMKFVSKLSLAKRLDLCRIMVGAGLYKLDAVVLIRSWKAAWFQPLNLTRDFLV